MRDSYFSQLWGLLREWRQNPVIAATRPWRFRGVRRMAFYGLPVLLSIVAIPIGWRIHSASSTLGHTYSFSVAFFSIPLLTALSLHLFGYRHRHSSHLEQLALTPLTRNEVAFGAIFWGVIVSCLLILPVMIGYGFTLIGNWDQMGYDFLVLGFLWIASVCAAVRSWILAFGRLIHLLLYTVAVATALYILCMVFSAYDPDPILLLVLVAVAVYLLRQAGRFAGLRFFAPVDWEELCRVYWLTNELVAFSESEERYESMCQIRRRNPSPFLPMLLGWASGGVLLILTVIGIQIGFYRGTLVQSGMNSWFRWIGEPGIALPPMLIAVAISLWVRYRVQKRQLFIASGSIHVSLFHHVFLPSLPFAILIVGGGLQPMIKGAVVAPFPWDSINALCVGWALSMGIGLAVVALPPFDRTLRIALGLSMGLWILHVGGTWILFRKLVPGGLSDASLPGEADLVNAVIFPIQRTVLIASGCIAVLLVSMWSRWCQNLHRSCLSKVERHTLVCVPSEKKSS